MSRLIFSEKSWDMLGYPSKIDIAEGAARTSKSTTVMFKLGLIVNQSKYTQFFHCWGIQRCSKKKFSR